MESNKLQMQDEPFCLADAGGTPYYALRSGAP